MCTNIIKKLPFKGIKNYVKYELSMQFKAVYVYIKRKWVRLKHCCSTNIISGSIYLQFQYNNNLSTSIF